MFWEKADLLDDDGFCVEASGDILGRKYSVIIEEWDGLYEANITIKIDEEKEENLSFSGQYNTSEEAKEKMENFLSLASSILDTNDSKYSYEQLC